jgi:hypothetical protein
MQYEHGRFEPRLEIVHHPPRKWFMRGAHNSDHFTFKVVLRTRFLMRGMRGVLPLRLQLLYDNDYPVEDQTIVEFAEEPQLFLDRREAVVRVRLLQASTWPAHGNRHFYFRVSTPAMVAGEAVTPCCTKAFQVLSKSVEVLKAELRQLGEDTTTTVDDSRTKFGVDQKGVVGNRAVTSSMTIALTRSDQRKALLQRRIDNHGKGYEPPRALSAPPPSEQARLFKMYNKHQADRAEYFKKCQAPPVQALADKPVRQDSLEHTVRESRRALSELRAMLPVLSEEDRREPGAPSTVDNGLWKRGLPMYKKPAEVALAKHYLEDERFAEADQLCERAYKIQCVAMGERHPVCATTLLLWGQSNRMQGLTEDALRRELLALQIRFENYHTVANPLCIEALDAVCATHVRRRDFWAARCLCDDARSRYVDDLGVGHEAIVGLWERATRFAAEYERCVFLFRRKKESRRTARDEVDGRGREGGRDGARQDGRRMVLVAVHDVRVLVRVGECVCERVCVCERACVVRLCSGFSSVG